MLTARGESLAAFDRPSFWCSRSGGCPTTIGLVLAETPPTAQPRSHRDGHYGDKTWEEMMAGYFTYTIEGRTAATDGVKR